MIMCPLLGLCIPFAEQECRKVTTAPHSLLPFFLFPSLCPIEGGPQHDEFWQLKATPETRELTGHLQQLPQSYWLQKQMFPISSPHHSGTSCLNWAHAEILCAPSAAVLSKQRLNLPSCWSGSDSIALWEIHLLPAAWPKLFSMPRKFWMSSHLFFSYCHQQRKWEIRKSWPVLQTKSPSLGRHWELTQREYKRRGVVITFAAKVLEVPRTQSKKMQKMW